MTHGSPFSPPPRYSARRRRPREVSTATAPAGVPSGSTSDSSGTLWKSARTTRSFGSSIRYPSIRLPRPSALCSTPKQPRGPSRPFAPAPLRTARRFVSGQSSALNATAFGDGPRNTLSHSPSNAYVAIRALGESTANKESVRPSTLSTLKHASATPTNVASRPACTHGDGTPSFHAPILSHDAPPGPEAMRTAGAAGECSSRRAHRSTLRPSPPPPPPPASFDDATSGSPAFGTRVFILPPGPSDRSTAQTTSPPSANTSRCLAGGVALVVASTSTHRTAASSQVNASAATAAGTNPAPSEMKTVNGGDGDGDDDDPLFPRAVFARSPPAPDGRTVPTATAENLSCDGCVAMHALVADGGKLGTRGYEPSPPRARRM